MHQDAIWIHLGFAYENASEYGDVKLLEDHLLVANRHYYP